MESRQVARVVVVACLLLAVLIFALVSHRSGVAVTVSLAGVIGSALGVAGEDRRAALRDWRPSRRTYLLPLAVGPVGLIVAAAVPGHTNPVIGVGIALFALSMTALIAIWFKRVLNGGA